MGGISSSGRGGSCRRCDEQVLVRGRIAPILTDNRRMLLSIHHRRQGSRQRKEDANAVDTDSTVQRKAA